MPSRSTANLLDLAAADSDFPSSPRHPSRLPRVMADPCILSTAGAAYSPPASPSSPPQRRIIVSHHLPLRATPDPAAPTGWSFSYDPDALVLQLRSGLPADAEVLHVGTLRGLPDGLDPAHHDAIAAHLRREFRCVPVLLSPDLHARFYHGFCKHYLWPLFHYLLPLIPSSLGGLRFDLSLWRSYLSVNKLFADRLTELVNPDDDFVWIHDYHLLALPTFLRKRSPRAKLGFFLHSPFPSSEIFRKAGWCWSRSPTRQGARGGTCRRCRTRSTQSRGGSTTGLAGPATSPSSSSTVQCPPMGWGPQKNIRREGREEQEGGNGEEEI